MCAFSGAVYSGISGVSDATGLVTLWLPEGAYRFRADQYDLPFWSGSSDHCEVPGSQQVTLSTYAYGNDPRQEQEIVYPYDALNRLTAADYSSGIYFHYTYDGAGNRLTQTVTLDETPVTTTYTYDEANRLSQVDAQAYTWDNNGNLLSDGEKQYSYDPANRLTALVEGEDTTYYLYNGQGDRIAQIEDGVQTPYILDLNAGLTQVLNDGTTAYVYGLDLVSQQTGINEEYPLRDALGSMRQMTDQSSAITGYKSFEPYGSLLASSGETDTPYGFAGEWTDASGMQYLRARFYDPSVGRFVSRDRWEGDYITPISYNKWLYGNGNPVVYTDPTGRSSEDMFDALFGIGLEGNWINEDKGFVRSAVSLVADRFFDVLGSNWSGGVPYSAAPALAFTSVYGIRLGDQMRFEWDPNCYGCRPEACKLADLWENQEKDNCNCESLGTCACKPSGGLTMSSRWIKFASMWGSSVPDFEVRRINNVIHELGHAFNNRIGRIPSTEVGSYPPITNESKGGTWLLLEKPQGFYLAEKEGQRTYMQSLYEDGSETFADMFIGWVSEKWAPDEYGKERERFMNERMGGWIAQAIHN